ncbi:MAG: PaaI family thioesterase [Rhodospirillaceae bacterium]|nr:PaaI family thioesterase [Rhodospirillaceae bacterium]MBL6930281.1 PaaI family thioesterase [Rhodospirillales bacterium]MBL6940669.1 PaaI family thioesterase [Rhodospirillales bacterium]
MPKMTIEEFNKLLADEMPFAVDAGLRLAEMKHGEATMVLPYDGSMLRPGGTISGPSMMMLADAAMYAVVLSMIGPVALAVTTNFNINFLRKPAPGDISAEGKIIKLGKRLAVIQVTLFSVNDEEPVAHSTGTYSIPPLEKRG